MSKLLTSFSMLSSVLILGVIIVFTGRQSLRTSSFYLNSVTTVGKVTNVSSQNELCQITSRDSPYDCTVFGVEISYNTPQGTISFWKSAGTAREHNMGYEYAEYKLGDTVPIVYDSRNPYLTEDKIAIEWQGLLLAVLVGGAVVVVPGLLIIGTIDALYETIKSGGFLGKVLDILVTTGLSIMLGIIFFCADVIFLGYLGF